MEEAFDPYRKWLGIPPEEQPPNHYRLLGIALFEDDADVISNAADRQMSHVRTYQTGKRAPLSQALLNELSAAKLCLLNPAQKKTYDGELAARHARLPRAVASPAAATVAAEPTRGGAPAPLPVGATVVKVASAGSNDAASQQRGNGQTHLPTAAAAPIAVRTRVSRGRPVRRSSPSAAITAVAAVGLLVILVLFVAFFRGGDGDASGDRNRSTQRSSKKTKPDASGHSSPKSTPSNGDDVGVPIVNSTGRGDLSTRPVKPKPSGTTPKGQQGDGGDDDPNDDPGGAPRSDDSAPKTPRETPALDESSPIDDESPSRPAVVKRPPPPSPAAIDKAYRIVRKEFEPQLREALQLEERFELARQIVERAETAGEPATKYALYLLTLNLSVQLASADQACDVVDLLASHFDVDTFEMKRKSLDDISQFVTLEVEDYTHLLRLMQRLARDALSAENIDAAVALTRLSKATSLKVRTPRALKELPRLEDLLGDVDRLAADVAEYDREVKSFDRSLRLLERDANDAGAHLSVGRYWLLVKGDWPKALPHLARGADPAWKDPATIDLARPQSPSEQTALADTWYALALRKGGLSAPPLFERAKTWYGRAIESAPETDKPDIAAKIADVEKQLQALRPPRDPGSSDEVPPTDGGPAYEKSADEKSADRATSDTPALDAAKPDDDGPAFPD